MKRNIYVAGWFGAQARLRPMAVRIAAKGHKVVSTWLWEETADPDDATKRKYAERDRLEIVWDADLLILDTNEVSPTGGREVEYGYARMAGVETWIVGPKRNVFHELSPHFETWEDVLITLAKED
jgi:hypothetical protein